jgi:hypothetical protein
MIYDILMIYKEQFEALYPVIGYIPRLDRLLQNVS